MKFLIILSLLVGCGSHLHDHNGSVRNAKVMREIAKIIKHKFAYPEDALTFIRTHPLTKTIGIHSTTVAHELDIHPSVWGRYVNAESNLVIQLIMVDGKQESLIFAKWATPTEQITKVLDGFDAKQFKRGVPITQVADNVSFRQESWTDHGFHIAIGHLLDRKKYVSRQINGVTYIFAMH